MTLEQLLKARREEILRVSAQHDARSHQVIGSVAHGEARESTMMADNSVQRASLNDAADAMSWPLQGALGWG
jgi:hypothetical protein